MNDLEKAEEYEIFPGNDTNDNNDNFDNNIDAMTPENIDSNHSNEEIFEHDALQSEAYTDEEEIQAQVFAEADEPEAGQSTSQEPSVREYHYEESVKRHPKKKRGWAKFVVGCAVVGITGGSCVGAGYGLVEHYFLEDQTSVTRTPISVQRVSTVVDGMSAVDIIKQVKPSVVSISTKVSAQSDYFGSFSVPYEMTGMGSGIIFDEDDSQVWIVTNNHVVDGANSIYVTLNDTTNVPAKVVGAQSESDIAVLSVSWSDLKNAGITDISVATFGDSEELEVGDNVIAIGNAMGMGLSATDGIISMTEQKIVVDNNELTVLQTSAAINGGNSGGALVNSAGEVIGINTAKYNSSMAEGMGYAIPSNVITPIAEQLFADATQPKPYIGIKGTSITTENAELYKLPVGALVMEVTEGGPADEAGLLVGDIVTEFNGKTIMDMDTLVAAVQEAQIGKTVNIHIIRDGENGMDLTMKISDKNA